MKGACTYMIKRLTSAFFVCALLSCFLCVSVKAEVLTGTNQFSVFKAKTVDELRVGGSSAGQYDISYSQADIKKSLSDSAYTAYWYFGLHSLQGFANIPSVTGTIVVSFSYYYGSSGDRSFGSAGDYTPVTTFDRLSGTGLTGTGEFITFEPVTTSAYHSSGVAEPCCLHSAEASAGQAPRSQCGLCPADGQHEVLGYCAGMEQTKVYVQILPPVFGLCEGKFAAG